MFSYYLQKGHQLKDLLALSFAEKLFYQQSMAVELEHKADLLTALGGTRRG